MSVEQAGIPTINLQPWIDGSDQDFVIAEVRAACETYGFMQVVGHGIPPEVQEKAFECAKTFFAMPTDQKLALKKNQATGRGYEPLRSQGLQSANFPDEKEASLCTKKVLNARSNHSSR
jgi:isopenicillin N synthase-like dioxygenase